MNDNNMNCSSNCTNVIWWATLTAAVIGVPVLAFTISKMLGVQGMMEIAVFMVTCWWCTYLGMRLMKNPKVSDKFNIKN